MDPRKLGGIASAASAVITTYVAWTTAEWDVLTRCVVMGIASLGVLAGAVAVFAHYSKSLTGRRRWIWSAAIAGVLGLSSISALYATLVLHSVRYTHGKCPGEESWQCVGVAAPREPTTLTIELSVQHLAGAEAKWSFKFWSKEHTGIISEQSNTTSMSVRIEGMERPTRFGVSYLTSGTRNQANLRVLITAPGHVKALSAVELRSWADGFAVFGGAQWCVGTLLLFFWPRLASLLWPKPKPPGFRTRES